MTQAISTIKRIVEAPNWNQRVAQIRLIPQHHGTGEHAQIFAEIARLLYVPHLAPDFAYIHEAPFYEQEYFAAAYDAAHRATRGFTEVSEDNLKKTIESDPKTRIYSPVTSIGDRFRTKKGPDQGGILLNIKQVFLDPVL